MKSYTVGYRLEDEAMKALPKLLKQDFGVEGYITPTNYNHEFA